MRAARADPDWWKVIKPAGGPYVLPKLGLRLDHNLVMPTVKEVFPDSVAEAAGIQVGDQITKVNFWTLDLVLLPAPVPQGFAACWVSYLPHPEHFSARPGASHAMISSLVS